MTMWRHGVLIMQIEWMRVQMVRFWELFVVEMSSCDVEYGEVICFIRAFKMQNSVFCKASHRTHEKLPWVGDHGQWF